MCVFVILLASAVFGPLLTILLANTKGVSIAFIYSLDSHCLQPIEQHGNDQIRRRVSLCQHATDSPVPGPKLKYLSDHYGLRWNTYVDPTDNRYCEPTVTHSNDHLKQQMNKHFHSRDNHVLVPIVVQINGHLML